MIANNGGFVMKNQDKTEIDSSKTFLALVIIIGVGIVVVALKISGIL